MSNTTIGTCGNCGGAVCVPHVWMGINPPTPQCVNCGATPVNPHGRRIKMNPSPKGIASDTPGQEAYNKAMEKLGWTMKATRPPKEPI